MTYSFALQSLGCKVSQYDAGRLRDRLVSLGFHQIEEPAVPDLFILNSCAVTGRASQKVRQALNGLRRKYPTTKIILAGCEAKYREIRESPSEDADAVFAAFPTETILRETLEQLGFKITPVISSEPETVTHRTRAFLKVQDGCTRFCSYCIVPHLRGSEWSKPVAEAVEESRHLVSAGHKEIVLTGIHLGRYQLGLLDLLQHMERIQGLERIRLSSIEPLEINEPLLDWLARSPKACQHLHLPLQAGEDTTLKRMNRPYNTAMFSDVVEAIRKKMPGIALTTDFIVGFPGETEDQFSRGLSFVETMAFSNMHIFRYSSRPGTPAADFPHQLGNPEKKARAAAAETLRQKLAGRYHSQFLHKKMEVLWETQNNGDWLGTSREYISCRLKRAASSFLANTLSLGIVCSTNSDEVEVVLEPAI